ncbi:MAG: hypothetical protein KC656_15065, partial [Myxococcales bacterium]|nr:hypothetical protein [Myxococcales bacterium]
MLFLAPTLSWADDVVARPTDDLDAIIADTPDSILAPWAHTIWLVPGDYVGAFVVDDEVLTLRAVVPGTVFLRAAPGQTEPVVRVQGGSHLALEGVVVSPGPYSIGVDVEASAALTLLRMAFYTTEASPTLLSTASTRDLQIAGSRFIGGSATTEGGHILHTGSGTLMLERVHFEGGSATSGGCIRSTGGPISVDRTLFDGCTAAVDGGAIHKDAGGRVDIVRSAFRDSSAGGWGGALYVHVDADISLSTVCGNTAGHAGGGLDWYGPLANALTITNTAFLDNQALTANDWGAAIRAATDRNVAIAVRSSSFARNSGSDVGTFYSSANPPGSVTLEGLEVETSTTTLYDLASQASTPVTFTTSNFWPDPYVGSPFWPGGTSITNDPRAYTTAQGTCDLGSVDVGTGAFGAGGLEDSDGDGYYVPFDCDDTSSAVHPGVLQDVGCDGRDDDCDGLVDEDSTGTPLFLDADGDGLGDDTWILDICTAEGPLLVDVAGDCDDTDAD